MQYTLYSLSYTCHLTLLRQAIAEAESSGHHVTSMLPFANVVYGN
jgi:hypothetical protein